MKQISNERLQGAFSQKYRWNEDQEAENCYDNNNDGIIDGNQENLRQLVHYLICYSIIGRNIFILIQDEKTTRVSSGFFGNSSKLPLQTIGNMNKPTD